MAVVLTGRTLTVEEVLRVARAGERVELAPAAVEQLRTGRLVIEEAIERGTPVYGLNTGVGVRKRTAVDTAAQDDFNRRLILDHRVGQGPLASEPIVRAAMLRLANGLARGTSGVRVELVEHVVGALNSGVVPAVRMLGSNGQADLPALADLAQGLLGDFRLGAKEGLALLDNNAFSTGIAALAVADARRLLGAADTAGALDLEALVANLSTLDRAVGEQRPYPGIQSTIERFRALLEGSYLWQEGTARNLQDPLVFRCLPQIHGAARDALAFVEAQLAIELNASQENPLLVPGEGRLVSVGNFDVLPLAAALDFMRIALAPVLTSASERTVKLMQESLTRLPDGLSAEPGLANGALGEFGIPVQALAVEARLLAQPVSVESGSSMQHEGIEDRMTLAPLAARRLAEQVSLGERVVAVELVVASQAIDLRGQPQLGAGTGRAYAAVRELVPMTGPGEPPPQDLEPVCELVRASSL
ncbi:MAG: HAL/PAL/TAL family ammonia-lyase [Gaiellaceae bacterium]